MEGFIGFIIPLTGKIHIKYSFSPAYSSFILNKEGSVRSKFLMEHYKRRGLYGKDRGL
jgi:hypothetical protein